MVLRGFLIFPHRNLMVYHRFSNLFSSESHGLPFIFESSLIGIWWFTIGLLIFSHRSKLHYCQTHWFQRFLWVGSSCWEEVTLFHCKSCAFIRSKPHYCQKHWFQRFFVGWLLMLGRGGLFHCKSCAFIRSKPHYCQTPWFQRFFGSWWWEKVSFYRYLGGFH